MKELESVGGILLSYFPIIYPDENIYSIISRYHIHIANLSSKWTSEQLFNNKRANPNIFWGNNINNLFSTLPENKVFALENIIDNHTFLNIYKPFILEKRYIAARENIINGKISNVNNQLGITAGEIFERNIIKVCKKCIEEDFYKYGETYLRRTHQIPGNMVCVKHKELLSVIKVNIAKQQYFDYYEYKNKIEDINNVNDSIKEKLLKLSRNIVFILQNFDCLSYLDLTKNKILLKMKENGYITVKGIVRHNKIQRDLIDFYGNDFLKLLKSELNIIRQHNWFKVFFLKKNKYIHPIRGLLIILFLFGDFKSFVDYKLYEPMPFGEGPWPCLNPVCIYYNKPVIKNYEIKRNPNNNKILGIFKCECGYEYKVTGSIKDIQELMKRHIVSDRGQVWIEKLTKEVKKGQSLRRIAEIMGVSKQTVKKYIFKLDLSEYLINKSIKIEQYVDKSIYVPSLEKKEECINKIKTFIQQSDVDLNRTKIRNANRKEYDYLKKHSNDDLEAIIPKSIKPNKRNESGGNNKVDWNKRDVELCNKLKSIMDELKGKKITKSMIIKKLRYTSLYKTIVYVNLKVVHSIN